jgi:hypothetical protein
MKKIIIILVLILGTTPAYADVYVKVDANGNAIGGAIMCDAGTCGAGSQFSQLTLQAGEQYVLQGTGQAGIGNNNPNTQVKVDIPTNEWTVTRQIEIKPTEPVVINNQQVIAYTVETVETFTPATSPGNGRPVIVAPIVAPTPTQIDTTTITAGSVATATATTLTVNRLNKPNINKSTVITGTKNGVKITSKENAKALIRTKGKR